MKMEILDPKGLCLAAKVVQTRELDTTELRGRTFKDNLNKLIKKMMELGILDKHSKYNVIQSELNSYDPSGPFCLKSQVKKYEGKSQWSDTGYQLSVKGLSLAISYSVNGETRYINEPFLKGSEDKSIQYFMSSDALRNLLHTYVKEFFEIAKLYPLSVEFYFGDARISSGELSQEMIKDCQLIIDKVKWLNNEQQLWVCTSHDVKRPHLRL